MAAEELAQAARQAAAAGEVFSVQIDAGICLRSHAAQVDYCLVLLLPVIEILFHRVSH